MRTFLGALAGFAAYRLAGFGGLLALASLGLLFHWSESHPRWRWPSLAATFLTGLGVLLGCVWLLADAPESVEALMSTAPSSAVTIVALNFFGSLMIGSAIMVPVYGYRAFHGWMVRKGLVQVAEPIESLYVKKPGSDLPA